MWRFSNATFNQARCIKVGLTANTPCFWAESFTFPKLPLSTDRTCYKNICYAQEGERLLDPTVVTFGELLEVFWRTHDPTTLNRQGADVGTQYRSAIFPMNEEQERVARASLAAAEEAGLWNAPIVTSIEPLAPFYVAEDYHQDYFANNPDQGYCVAVVGPKVKKFKALFADKLKSAH